MNDIKKIVRKSAASFFWSAKLLPRAKRQAMYTIYAFCQHIDKLIDEPGDLNEKLELLQIWEQELDNIYDKKAPMTEIGRRIYKNCMRFKLPKSDFVQLISSAVMNLEKPILAPSLQDFFYYCAGVAGAPGSMTLRILGCEDEKLIRDLSLSLGNALEITNILRNVKDDADAGKIYIPSDFLQKAEIASREPSIVVVDNNLSIAREELAKIALQEFNVSYHLIAKLNKKAAKPIKAVANVYKRYFDIMQNRGWEVISPKPHIGKLGKLKIIFKAFLGK